MSSAKEWRLGGGLETMPIYFALFFETGYLVVLSSLCPTHTRICQVKVSFFFLFFLHILGGQGISWDVTFVPVIKMAARAPAIAYKFQAPGCKREEEEGARRDPN